MSKFAHAAVGSRVYAEEQRDENDFYATDPIAVHKLLEHFKDFHHFIWEPACGKGHISEALKEHGYSVISSDLFDYGYGESGIDFLKYGPYIPIVERGHTVDIVTNPPFKYSLEFAQHALDVLSEGCYVALFLKLGFLEGKERRKFF